MICATLLDSFIYVKGREAIPFIRIGDIIARVCLIVVCYGPKELSGTYCVFIELLLKLFAIAERGPSSAMIFLFLVSAYKTKSNKRGSRNVGNIYSFRRLNVRLINWHRARIPVLFEFLFRPETTRGSDSIYTELNRP